MLVDEKLVAFLATTDAGRARRFYEGVLGLTLHSDNEFLITFASGGHARVSLQKSPGPITPPFGTALSWNVADIRASVRELMAAASSSSATTATTRTSWGSGRRRPEPASPGSRTRTVTSCRSARAETPAPLNRP